jgi:hypothetical protein
MGTSDALHLGQDVAERFGVHAVAARSSTEVRQR